MKWELDILKDDVYKTVVGKIIIEGRLDESSVLDWYLHILGKVAEGYPIIHSLSGKAKDHE